MDKAGRSAPHPIQTPAQEKVLTEPKCSDWCSEPRGAPSDACGRSGHSQQALRCARQGHPPREIGGLRSELRAGPYRLIP